MPGFHLWITSGGTDYVKPFKDFWFILCIFWKLKSMKVHYHNLDFVCKYLCVCVCIRILKYSKQVRRCVFVHLHFVKDKISQDLRFLGYCRPNMVLDQFDDKTGCSDDHSFKTSCTHSQITALCVYIFHFLTSFFKNLLYLLKTVINMWLLVRLILACKNMNVAIAYFIV